MYFVVHPLFFNVVTNQKLKQSYVCRISSCFNPKYLLVMLTLEWLNNSMSLTNANSALSEDSNTFLPKVLRNECVEKWSIFKL